MNSFFISYKNPIAVVLLIIVAGGLYSYSQMQSSLFPEVTFPKIKIIADNGLQPVDKTMVTVTKPLENAIKKVPNLKVVRSTTSRGSCEISAFMDWKANIDLSRQQIESAINEVKNDLPSGIAISVEVMNPSILQVMGYTIEGRDKNNIELNTIAKYLVKPYLSQAEGVSDIMIMGGRTKEYRIELKPDKMTLLGITPSKIADALGKTNFISANGYINDFNRMYLSVTDAGIKNIDELQNIVISGTEQRLVTLKDVAEIKIAEQTVVLPL